MASQEEVQSNWGTFVLAAEGDGPKEIRFLR